MRRVRENEIIKIQRKYKKKKKQEKDRKEKFTKSRFKIYQSIGVGIRLN